MSPAPRIGRITKNSEAAHDVALPPSAPLTAEQAAAEEATKKQLVQRYRDEAAASEARPAGTKTAQPPTRLDDEIAQRAFDLAVEEAARRTNAKERHRTINEAKIAPLVARLEHAKVALKELRAAALVKVTAWAGIDVGALVRGYRWKVEPFVPGTAPGPNGEPGTASSGGISGGERVALLQRAAATAVSAMTHNFAVSDDAVRRANVSASSDSESQERRMAADHLRKSVATSESTVAAGQSAVANAEALYAKVKAALAEAEPIDNPVMPPEVEWLPTLPRSPAEPPTLTSTPASRSGHRSRVGRRRRVASTSLMAPTVAVVSSAWKERDRDARRDDPDPGDHARRARGADRAAAARARHRGADHGGARRSPAGAYRREGEGAQ